MNPKLKKRIKHGIARRHDSFIETVIMEWTIERANKFWSEVDSFYGRAIYKFK